MKRPNQRRGECHSMRSCGQVNYAHVEKESLAVGVGCHIEENPSVTKTLQKHKLFIRIFVLIVFVDVCSNFQLMFI